MSFIATDPNGYALSEFEVNTNTGAVTQKGPITVKPPVGTIVSDGAIYDSTIPGWRLLVFNPL